MVGEESTIRHVAATTATVLGFALTATVFALMAPPAAQARVIDCVVQPQPPKRSLLRAGVGERAADHHDLPRKTVSWSTRCQAPNSNPSTCSRPRQAQLRVEHQGFFHDHVIATAPSEGGFTPFMHGYLVICSPEGISTGACTFNVETFPGGVPLQLTKSVTGYNLTFAADIQAAASAGLVVLVDTGAVFIGTVGPSS